MIGEKLKQHNGQFTFLSTFYELAACVCVTVVSSVWLSSSLHLVWSLARLDSVNKLLARLVSNIELSATVEVHSCQSKLVTSKKTWNTYV